MWGQDFCIFRKRYITGIIPTRVGTSPFSQYELKSVDDLQQMVVSLRSDLKNGFERVGAADLFEGFVTQVNQGDVDTIEVQPGQKMQWMIFRNARAVKVITDLVWAAEKPFTAYQLDVEKSGTRYSFIIPVTCGNVALAQTSTVPAPASAPQPVTAPRRLRLRRLRQRSTSPTKGIL